MDEMRFFWISWFDDVIRFGRGQQQGSDQIAEYSEPLSAISAVSLYGYDTPVTYEVRNFEGKGFFLQIANNEVILLKRASSSIETGHITLCSRLHSLSICT